MHCRSNDPGPHSVLILKVRFRVGEENANDDLQKCNNYICKF